MEDRNYVRRVEDVVLLPGAASAVKRLNDTGVAAVVVTNQSGIARGIFDEKTYESVRGRLDDLLAADGDGARLDATLHCPHHPQFTGPCDCRKPGTALHRRAIAELDLDPSRLAFIGDRWHDLVPANALGGMGVIVTSPVTPPDEMQSARAGANVAPDLAGAVDIVLKKWGLA